ncbi:MAG: class I SAM-dependent methyltransferase [SAR324 cluster bacterium]|nr:class I SAM-dependent methyltransferase [SAR324 cluster bacterium]
MHRFKSTLQSVKFPEVREEGVSQDQEYMLIVDHGGEGKRKIRFHDYHEIYSIPGLYEHLFYERLKCQSPQTISKMMQEELQGGPMDASDLVVLDVGAGNGMVGEELSNIGVKSIVGIDIIDEAAEAANRDRPEIYEDYYVADLTQLPEDMRRELNDKQFNCMVSVSALGFGDIPPLAFAEAYNMVSTPGLVAFNIKDEFMSTEDSSGFSRLIDRIIDAEVFEPAAQHRYMHRLSMDGSPLYYVAMVGTKNADIPTEWVE